MYRLKHLTANSLAFSSDGKAFAIFFYFYLFEGFVSCLISDHSNCCSFAPRRWSSSLRSTRARKLQNTWPAILASFWWYIGLVSKSDLTSRNTRSTRQSSLYLTATRSVGNLVLVTSTHLISKRASAFTLAGSIRALSLANLRYLR